MLHITLVNDNNSIHRKSEYSVTFNNYNNINNYTEAKKEEKEEKREH